jgi:hypothetical protein
MDGGGGDGDSGGGEGGGGSVASFRFDWKMSYVQSSRVIKLMRSL